MDSNSSQSSFLAWVLLFPTVLCVAPLGESWPCTATSACATLFPVAWRLVDDNETFYWSCHFLVPSNQLLQYSKGPSSLFLKHFNRHKAAMGSTDKNKSFICRVLQKQTWAKRQHVPRPRWCPHEDPWETFQRTPARKPDSATGPAHRTLWSHIKIQQTALLEIPIIFLVLGFA